MYFTDTQQHKQPLFLFKLQIVGIREIPIIRKKCICIRH